MNIQYPVFARCVAVLLGLVLGGCLNMGSKEESDGGSSPTPPSNSAPTISGNPSGSVTIGNMYSFTPNASDPDGDPLTFSVANLPNWASFNANNGNVSGQPTLGDIGSYSSIRITVSDGQASTSMSGFTITVIQSGNSSVTLSWSAPTQNEDGSTLTDLAGYTIYYGGSSGNYSNEIRINNPSVTTYVVENLSPNTYYFVATAFDAGGTESRYSGEFVATVN